LFCSFNVGIKGLMTHSTHYRSLRIYFYSTTKSLTSRVLSENITRVKLHIHNHHYSWQWTNNAL